MFWMYFLAYSAFILAAIILLNTIQTAAYDIKDTFLKNRSAQNSKKPSKTSLVSVVITCRNDALTITNCLESVFSSYARKIEVVVVDNNSTDNTTRLVKQHIKAHPKRRIRLVAKRKYSVGLQQDVNAFKKYISGEILLVIRGNIKLSRAAIGSARAVFDANPNLDLLTPEVTTDFQPQIIRLAKVVKNLFVNRKLKSPRISISSSRKNSAYFIRYTRMQTKKLHEGHDSNIDVRELSNSGKLGQDINIYHESPASLIDFIFALILLILFSASILAGDMTFFIVGWLAATLDYALMIFGSNIKLSEKFRIAFYAPIMYIFSILSLVSYAKSTLSKAPKAQAS